jgi:hypothetical protein
MPKRARCAAAPSSDVAELLSAVQECGGRLDGAELADCGATGLGLLATRDLRVGEVVAHVPGSAILCVDTALRSRLGQAVAKHVGVHLDGAAIVPGGVPARAALQLYLIACRHPGENDDVPRAHRAYAASLPHDIPLPVAWPEQLQCSLLAGTDLERRVAHTVAELRRQHEACFPCLTAAEPALFPAAVFSWPAFLWAHTVLSSRAFPASCLSGTEDDAADVEACGVLIPVLDIANHSTKGGDLRWEPATCTMVMTRPVAAGAQIWLSYGHKTSAAWLSDYGFVPWDNGPHDAVCLRMGAVFSADTDAPSRRNKLKLWAQLTQSSALSLDCTLTHATPLPRQLLMAAHVCCLTPTQAASTRQLSEALLPSAAAAAASMISQLLQRRIDALYAGAGGKESYSEQLHEVQSLDCVSAGLDGSCPCAVSPSGASAAYRESCRRILLAAHQAACELCK